MIKFTLRLTEDEKNDPMILEKYLEFIYELNSDISKMIEKEELIN